MLGKDMLGLYGTAAEDIVNILDTASGMKKTAHAEPEKTAALAGQDGHDLILRKQYEDALLF